MRPAEGRPGHRKQPSPSVHEPRVEAAIVRAGELSHWRSYFGMHEGVQAFLDRRVLANEVTRLRHLIDEQSAELAVYIARNRGQDVGARVFHVTQVEEEEVG